MHVAQGELRRGKGELSIRSLYRGAQFETSSSSSSKRIPLTPGRDREIFPPATADSQSHRQEQTQVGSVSACILALFSPPGQWRSVNARTAPRLDQKLCGHHDRPVQSLSLLSLSFVVFRRARPIRLAPSRSLALSRAPSLSLSLSRVSPRPSPSRTLWSRVGCRAVSATVPSRHPRLSRQPRRQGSGLSVPALPQGLALVKESHVRRPPSPYCRSSSHRGSAACVSAAFAAVAAQ